MERAAEARESAQGAGRRGEGLVQRHHHQGRGARRSRSIPRCNAWWQDDHIRYWHEVHVGMAVAIEDGLITPVIRDADRKIARGRSPPRRRTSPGARGSGSSSPRSTPAATFSVSNLGMFDIDEFTAVINPPEAGILAVGRIAQKPVVRGWRSRSSGGGCGMTMSCDHRVIDGATGAQFLKTLKTDARESAGAGVGTRLHAFNSDGAHVATSST